MVHILVIIGIIVVIWKLVGKAIDKLLPLIIIALALYFLWPHISYYAGNFFGFIGRLF